MSKVLPKVNKSIFNKDFLAKALSVVYLLVIVAATYAMIHSYGVDPTYGLNNGLQNIGRALSLGGIVIVVLISWLQKNMYWDFSKRPAGLDEREIALRRKVFERSYKLAILILAIAVYEMVTHAFWIVQNVQHSYVGTSVGDMVWAPINLVVLLIALPPIVAAWQKSSTLAHSDETVSQKRTKLGFGSALIRVWLGLWLLFLVSILLPGVNGVIGVGYATLLFGPAILLTLPVIVILTLRFLRNNH